MTTPDSFAELKEHIQRRHVEQLRTLQVHPDARTPEQLPIPTAGSQDILTWIRNNQRSIDAAIASQAVGGNQVDWNVALLQLVESAAMYLRQRPTVARAIDAAKLRNDQTALELLNSAQTDIEQIADAMGLNFVVLCDLVDISPDGHWFWSGAFCGLFLPKQKNTRLPFLGVAFKGTGSFWEGLLDAAYTPVAPQGGTLFGTEGVKVHEGFYAGLFGTYQQAQTTVIPFELILGGLLEASAYFDVRPSPVHTTGHSLGGAYASLSYAEILRRMSVRPPPTTFFELRDLNTFGGPRVALLRLPELVKQNMQAARQRTWRVCADGDPVPTVPPPPWPLTQYDYIHYDSGVKVFTDRAPAAMGSEMPNSPVPPVVPTPGNVAQHGTDNYYLCVVRALASPKE